MSAARTPSGAVVAALVNLDPNQAIPVTATIAGVSVQRVSGEILTAPAMDAHNTFENPYSVYATPFTGASLSGGVLSLTLPAKAVVVLMLQ
jgi:alpha-N-arabinofuranosidase